MIEVKFDENALRYVQTMLQETPNKIPQVAARAINRAATKGRTEIAREIRKVYTVKHGAVIKTLKISRAFKGSLSAQIQSTGSPIFLTNFKVTPSGTRSKSQVYASVKKGSRRPIASGFVGKAPSGRAVYTRIGTPRYPIKALYGPSIPQMAGNEIVTGNVAESIENELIKRLEHEVGFILGM